MTMKKRHPDLANLGPRALARGAWRALLAAGLILAAPASHADDLLSLYRQALDTNAAYQAARADNEAQKEVLPQARAQLLPNLSISGNQSRNTTEETYQSLFGQRTTHYDYNSHYYAATLRQPLFRPYNFALYAQSKAQVVSADARLDQALQDMAVAVGTAYFNVLLARSELEVNRFQQQAYAGQLTYAQKAFKSGQGTRTDIDEAQSRLDAVEAQAIQLEYTLNYNLEALRATVGRPLTPLAELHPERLQLVPPDPANLDEWVRVAEDVNPKLRSLRADLEAAEKEVWKARSGHMPTVDAIAQRSNSKSDTNTSIGTEYDTRMVGVQVTIPIFSGGYVNSTVRQALDNLEKIRQQLEATRRDIALQVRKEFDGAAQGVHWVKAYQQAVKSAEQTLYSTKKGFQAGVRNNLDILNAEQNLASAQRDLSRGRYDYVLSRLRLMSLVGRLDEEEISHFNAWLEARDAGDSMPVGQPASAAAASLAKPGPAPQPTPGASLPPVAMAAPASPAAAAAEPVVAEPVVAEPVVAEPVVAAPAARQAVAAETDATAPQPAQP
jgi:outer membrane protein/protease secretion system outer membrane protein